MAIRIPKYDQHIGAETVNLPEVPHISAVEGAFGGDVARSNQAIGQAIGQSGQLIAKHMEEQRKLQNDAFVASQDTAHTKAIQDALIDPTPEDVVVNGQKVSRPKGYLGRMGTNAQGSLAEFDRWHDENAKETLNQIKDPETRLRVAKNIDQQYLSARNKVIEHESKQVREGYIQNLESNRDLKISNTFNVGNVEKAVDDIAVLQDKINKARGVDDATAQVEFKKAVGSFVKNMVDTTLQSDPTGDSARALLSVLSEKVADDDKVAMNKYIDTKVKENSAKVLDDLNSKFIDGTITLEDIQAANKEKEKGGIGSASARRMLQDLQERQNKIVNDISADSEVAGKYVEVVNNVLLNPEDSYKAKQILVNAMVDGNLSREEAQKINRIKGILDRQKYTRDGDIRINIPIIKNWFAANDSDKRELANTLSNYLTALDEGKAPEEARDEVLKAQYNKTYPQAPLGKDDKLNDPARERQFVTMSPAERFGRGFGQGVAGTVEGFGGALRWLKQEELGKAVSDYAQTMKKFYAIPDPKFTDQISAGFGSMATFFIPGMGITKGVQAVTFFPRLAVWLGVGASTALEATVEAGSAYQRGLEKGMPVRDAENAASKTFWTNIPMLAITNKLGVFGENGGRVARSLMAAGFEGFQEFSQQIISNMAVNDPTMRGAFESAVVGAIVGGGTKMSVEAGSALKELAQAKETMVKFDEKQQGTGLDSSERGSVINPFNEGGQDNSQQEPIEINPKESANIESMKDPNNPLNYKTAEEYVASKEIQYHQSQSKEMSGEWLQKGDKGYKKAYYSQAGEGIYFSPNERLVKSKYGKEGGATIEAFLDTKNTLDLGEKDAMYFDGRMVNYGEVVVDNFKREQQGLKPNPEPDIILTSISKKAKKWLIEKGYDSVTGMKGEMSSAPETVVFDKNLIKTKSQLISEWEAAQKKNKKLDKQLSVLSENALRGEGADVSDVEKAVELTRKQNPRPTDVENIFWDNLSKVVEGESLESDQKNNGNLGGLSNERGSVTIPFPDVKIPEITTPESLVKANKDFNQFADSAIVPLSTRLGRINESLRDALRKFEFNNGLSMREDLQKALPFMEHMADMPESESAALDLALKNADIQTINEIVDRNGIRAEYNDVRELLDDIYNRAKEVGLDVGYLDDYFPRRVNDSEEFLNYLRNSENWSAIDKAIKQEEARIGQRLNNEERAEYINKLLRGYGSQQIRISKPSNIKGRKIQVIDEQMNAFYKNSTTTLQEYIVAMNKAIEAKKFFGMNNKDVENSIGAYVRDLVDGGLINHAQEKEVANILKARFSERGTHGIWSFYKNLGYLYTMSSPISAITQIGDLAFSFYENGLYSTAKGLGKAFSQNKVTKQDLGIDVISDEFSDRSKTGEAVTKVFKLIGLEAFDNVGKETLINGAMDKLSKQAMKEDTALMQELERVFGDEAQQTLQDLKNQEPSVNVKYLLFSRLAKYQPIALSEMPEYYAKGGNLRIFYMLKSYTIKQIDVFNNEVFSQMQTNPKKAVGNLLKLSLALVSLNAGADVIKDILLGRPTKLSDLLVDNILRLFGFSKYTIYKAKREGLGEATMKTILPPIPFVDDLYKDIAKGENLSDYKLWNSIPFVGKFYYWWFGGGREYLDKKKRKRRSSGASF